MSATVCRNAVIVELKALPRLPARTSAVAEYRLSYGDRAEETHAMDQRII